VSNKITFVNNSPCTFYQLQLKFTGHNPLRAQNQISLEQNQPQVTEIVTNKQYDDFLTISQIIEFSNFQLQAYHNKPIFPSQHYDNGNKKSG
jgi:hypothetical protein